MLPGLLSIKEYFVVDRSRGGINEVVSKIFTDQELCSELIRSKSPRFCVCNPQGLCGHANCIAGNLDLLMRMAVKLLCEQEIGQPCIST